MKTRLTITDLTRMQAGHVCIAGYDEAGACIRPVSPPGIAERAIKSGGQAVVFPFASVEFDLRQPTPQPPHTEDVRFDPASIKLVGRLNENEKRSFLTKTLFPDIAAIFEQPITHGPGFSVADGQGPRSVGSIQVKGFHQVFYEQGDDNAWNFRIGFYDGQDRYYRLKITDLTWNYYCSAQRGEASDSSQIAARLTATLKSSKPLFLRIGLSRGWAKFPGRCFLQVNGLYTFPDYLQGKTFSDFQG